MAITFPSSPSTNDTHTEGSITYKYDGVKWVGVGLTPADRLVEGSNKLELDANNDLVYTGAGTLKVNAEDASDYIAEFNQVHPNNSAQILINSPSNGESRPVLLNMARAGVIQWSLGQGYLDTDNAFHFSTSSLSGGFANSKLRIHPDGKQESFVGYTASATNTFASWARTGGAIRADVGYNAVTLDYMYFGTGTSHPLALRVNNSTALFIDTNKRLLVGNAETISYKSNLNSSADQGGQIAQFVGATDDANHCVGIFAYSGTSNPTARGAKIQLNRARSTDGTTNTAIASGDLIGSIEWKGNDGTAFSPAAKIDVYCDATVNGADDMAGRMVFKTTPDGTAVPVERLRIDSSGTIQTINAVQSGGNASGGFKFTSQYSGKGYDIATQYATQANGGSGGTDPMFSGWWGSNNTLRINTDGQIKARTIELQSPDTDAQFAKWQVLTGAKQVNGNGTTNELFKIGHSAMGRLQVYTLHGKDDYSSGMRSRVYDIQLIYGNPSLQEESSHSSMAVDGTLTDITVAYNNSGGSVDYIITASVSWNATGAHTSTTPWVYWTWEGTNSIRPNNI